MSLPKFPKQALQVLRIIRDDVPRPEELPNGDERGDKLTWCGLFCPMGLHPKSSSSLPSCSDQFANGQCAESSTAAFLEWWDGIEEEDAQAAVDFIWGSEAQDD